MKLIRLIMAALTVLSLFSTSALALEHLKMSTTTSTDNSGLLKVLLPPFEKENNCKVDVIAVGTGVNRKDVMYNDFVILGPANDPAGIKGAKSAAEALKMITAKQARFVFRGDESGTHQKEKELWQAAGIKPEGKWYQAAGQG